MAPVPNAELDTVFHCGNTSIGFANDSSVNYYKHVGGPSWADAQHKLGLYTYQSLSPSDFTAFDSDYGNGGCHPTTENPGCHNFNK